MTLRFDAAHSVVRRTGVPEGWREASVGDLVRIVGGGTPDREQSAYWRNGTIHWITPTDLTANGSKYIASGAESISALGLENSNATLVPTNSIVFSTRGTVGSMALAAVPLTCNQSCEILVPKDGAVDAEFLYYLLHYGLPAFARLSGGTTFGAITRRDIARVRFAVPVQVKDQAAIARVLAAVDTALELTRARLAAAKTVAASLAEEAVSGKLVTVGMHSCGMGAWSHPRLGNIPTGWSVDRLGKLCVRIVDGTHQAVETNKSGVPFLYVSCVREGRILWKNASFITERTYARISKGRVPQAECVLYTAVGSYGNAALVSTSDPFSFQRHIAILYPKGTCLRGGYLAMWLNSSMGKRWSEVHAVGNAQKTVTLTELGKLFIAFPSPEVQVALCDVVAGADAVVDAINARLDALTNLKRSLMHDLLTGQVRVTNTIKVAA
jgi:type I restriction enzyme S subunit